MSLFLPYINNCCEIWVVTYKSIIDVIVKLQKKKAIRIISKVGKCGHTSKLFSELKLLKFKDLIDLKIATLMYKAHMRVLPVNIQTKLISNRSNDYCLRNRNKFKVRHARTNLKANCLSIYGVKVFNNLSKGLTEAKNVFCFKRLYKKEVFETY